MSAVDRATLPGSIDVHAHHYPERFFEACRRPDSRLEYREEDGRIVVRQGGAVTLATVSPLPPLSHRLKLMDEAGIEIQVLSLSAPNVYRFAPAIRRSITPSLNDDLVELASEAPDRFRVLASLPLPDVDAAIRELDRSLASPLVVGAVLCTTVDGTLLDSSVLTPLWEALNERSAIVFVHPTTGCCTHGLTEFGLSLVLGYVAETTNAIGRLLFSGVFENYPDIRWIFSHAGGSIPYVINRLDTYAMQFDECREAISDNPSRILGRIFFDTVTTHSPALRCAVETFGSDRLLFGTDYPHTPDGLLPFVDAVCDMGLDEPALGQVLRDNAVALMGL